jgi:hypothetical protein
MSERLSYRLGLCVLSGLLVALVQTGWTALGALDETMAYPICGLIFAVAVLFPYLEYDRWLVLRAIGLILVSTLSFYVAVQVATTEAMGPRTFTAASVAGAAIVLTPLFWLAPLQPKRFLYYAGPLIALAGGPVTWLTLTQGFWLVFAGHAVWHGLISVLLHYGTRRSVWSYLRQSAASGTMAR